MNGKCNGDESNGDSEHDRGNTNDEQNMFKCTMCDKQYDTNVKLKRHVRGHFWNGTCEFCGQSFFTLYRLRVHREKVHGKRMEKKQKVMSFICGTCGRAFNRKYNLTRHFARNHARARAMTAFSCRHCNCEFGRYVDLFEHVNQNHPLNQEGGRRASTHQPRLSGRESFTQDNETPFVDDTSSAINDGTTRAGTTIDEMDGDVDGTATNDDGDRDDQRHSDNNSIDESALNNGVMNRYIEPRGRERYDVLTFFGNIRDQVRTFLQSRVLVLGGIKWNLCVRLEMQRDDGQEVLVTSPYFRSLTYAILSLDESNDHNLNEAFQKMHASLETFMREGSGWYVNTVLKLEIHTVAYKPLHGSTYIPLPRTLAKSRSVLNILNDDDKCFLYCLLASLHPTTIEPERVEQYYQYEHEIDMSDIIYPVTLSQIRKVERQNENISINVFTYEDKTIVPLRITEKQHRLHHINLLWLTHSKETHYCLILDLNRFLSRTIKHNNQLYFCSYCLHGFYKETSLREHEPLCSPNGAQRVELPVCGKNDILEFKDFEKTLKVPFVIYGDFETVNVKLHTCQPNPKQSSITPTTKLEVCGFGYKVVCEDKRYTKPSVIYRGEDAGRKLIECLLQEQENIREILSHIVPMQITNENEDLIANATHCCLCKKRFTAFDKTHKRIVRHHNHLTGVIIGPACNDCNLQCKQSKFIPVIFHNLKNFDAHIICENIGLFNGHKLTCIAQNTEKYVSFSLDSLRFIDSLQFLPASLQTLVEDLAQDGLEAFSHLRSECDDDSKAQLLLRKGVYCYEYMDSFDRFDETCLPSKEQFYSTITKEHISDEDYDHALTVFQTFGMSSLGEYHDLYLKTDVLLLSDVFETFRNLCLKQYELDPSHFYTSPGLSWSACLKMSGAQLELLTDIDKVLMVEKGIRGGMSQISNRYEKANNAYLPEYDPSQPTKFIQYLDAVNLYGWAQVQPLPVDEFDFMSERDIETFDIMTIPEKGDVGFILEVSLEYPKELHDKHNCLPLAPERRVISNEELSPYAQHLLRKLHGLSDIDPLPKRGKVEKLLTTLEDKDHYVLHYRNLQLYLRLGMKLKTIHRILRFRQEAWMAGYINHNTEMRKCATSTFQKNFYKLMNVSVFGKTMENVRLHKNIELVHTESRLRKVTAKPTYKSTTIFNENLVAVELHRAKVLMNKAIYCGMTILDLSKCLMFDFWYNHIKWKYADSAILQMTDTDSLLFSCQTNDLYEDMKSSMDLFDTSDYPKNHTLHSDRNKKVLGKMKDETNGKPISEYVGLRSKMYSFLCNESEEKRAKGIAKVTVKKDLKHAYYKDALFNEKRMISSMTSLRSHKHALYGETIHKTSLSAFDDKRYLINAVQSYSYGHRNIPRVNSNTIHEDNANSDSMVEESANSDTMEDHDQVTVSIFPTEEEHITSYKTLNQQAFTIGDVIITPCVKQ